MIIQGRPGTARLDGPPRRRRVAASVAALLLSAAGGAAAQPPEALQAVVEGHRAECARFAGGTLALSPGAYTQTDLDGDGETDWLLDSHRLHCSSAATLFCGTGGCALTTLIDGRQQQLLAKGWAVQRLGPLTVLLLQVHGSRCGGTNLNSCVEALVWDRERGQFNSVAPPVP